MTVSELAPLIRRGDISAEEAARSILDRIDIMEPSISAYITVTADEAVARARDIDSMRSNGADIGPLGGVSHGDKGFDYHPWYT